MTLALEVERLKEEKTALRKKIVDQALALSAAADKKPSPSGPCQQLGSSDMSELRHRVSQLEHLLQSERQGKVACEKEIARLSRELHSSREESRQRVIRARRSGAESTDGPEDEEKRTLVSQVMELRAQNADLQVKLNSVEEETRGMARELEQKVAESKTLQKRLQTATSQHTTTPSMMTAQHGKEGSVTSTPLHIASTTSSTPLLQLLLPSAGDSPNTHHKTTHVTCLVEPCTCLVESCTRLVEPCTCLVVLCI